MAGPKAGSIVSMEILIEEDQVSPMRILLKLLRTTIYRPTAVSLLQEETGKSPSEIVCHFEECHQVAGARRTLDLKIVTIKAVKV
jgi:hypothetical protein